MSSICDKADIRSEEASNNDDTNAGVQKSLIGEAVNCSLCKKDVPKLIIFEHTYHHMFVGRKMYPCHVCGKMFAENGQLITHLTIHTGEKPFACDQCENTFRLSTSLKNHINKHHTKTKHDSCDQCDESFYYKKGLINHQRKVHGKETGFMCNKCELIFVTEKGMESHTQEDSCFKHCCPECGKVFKLSSSLYSHKKTHSAVDDITNNFHCGKCGTSFRRADVLKSHEKMHDNFGQIKCFCGKTFNRQDGLNIHMKRKH